MNRMLKLESQLCFPLYACAKHDARPNSLVGRFWRWHINFCPGWVLLVFMMSLGIALKHIPGIPSAFTASFYTGLGPMLLLGSGRFMFKTLR